MEGLFDRREAGLAAGAGVRRKSCSVALILVEHWARARLAEESHLDLDDFRQALTKLPAEQREVLTLIGASGLSYEEAVAVLRGSRGRLRGRDRHDQESPEPRPLEAG
jgi:DNA-directed RNA polymerase specialized sigma24 family protein